MKHLVNFILLISIVTSFYSCDGRYRALKNPTETLTENHLKASFSKKETFYPQEYTEAVTDTILNNGYRVNIKAFTQMDNTVVLTENTGQISHIDHFRNIVSDIRVYNDKQQIFASTIDKLFLKAHTDKLQIDLKSYILKGIEVNQLKSLEKNKVVIDIWYAQPKTANSLFYQLVIDRKGNFNLIKTSSLC